MKDLQVTDKTHLLALRDNQLKELQQLQAAFNREQIKKANLSNIIAYIQSDDPPAEFKRPKVKAPMKRSKRHDEEVERFRNCLKADSIPASLVNKIKIIQKNWDLYIAFGLFKIKHEVLLVFLSFCSARLVYQS